MSDLGIIEISLLEGRMVISLLLLIAFIDVYNCQDII